MVFGSKLIGELEDPEQRKRVEGQPQKILRAEVT
jgi:hypothetical protein